MLNRLILGVHPWKGWQQGRMNVENRVWKSFQKRRTDEPHIACEADEADLALFQLTHDRAIVFVARRPFSVIENNRLDSRAASSIEASRIRAIRNDDRDRRVECSIAGRLDQRL